MFSRRLFLPLKNHINKQPANDVLKTFRKQIDLPGNVVHGDVKERRCESVETFSKQLFSARLVQIKRTGEACFVAYRIL